VTPVQSASPVINEHEQELQELRQNVTALTNQCAQLDEANRAWQQYQLIQLDNFRNTIQNYLPIDDDLSLEQAAQQIINQIIKEREDFTEQYRALEKVNDDLRSGKHFMNYRHYCLSIFYSVESATNLETIKESYMNTINELNQELLAMQERSQQTNGLLCSLRHSQLKNFLYFRFNII
jgi:exonuclease VII small subunit